MAPSAEQQRAVVDFENRTTIKQRRAYHREASSATAALLREPKMARRIVPELISPTQASAVHPAFEAAAEQAPVLRLNLKEQAELAKSLLEPGRKLYVDISQESKVSWRKASVHIWQAASAA